MNLKHLTDKALMFEVKALVQQESTLLVKILHYIKEIDRRRLYSDYGKGDLIELVMDELAYSRDEARARIKAMRAMKDVPEVEAMLTAGKLNLTSVGIVQTLFSMEKREGKPFSIEQKREVLEKVSGKSTREVQKLAFSMTSKPAKLHERLKMISEEHYELTSVIDEETVGLINQLKGMLAHKHPNMTSGELIKILAKDGVKNFAPVKAKKSEKYVTRNIENIANVDDIVVADSQKVGAIPLTAQNSPITKPLSKAEIKRRVWERDQYKCTKCGSRHAIQEDHVIPRSMGGEYTLENIRLYCRSCNQRAAIQFFGAEKMEKHIGA